MIVYINDLIISHIESIYPSFQYYKKKMVYTFILRDIARNCYEFERSKVKKIICDKLEFELMKNVVDLKKYNIDIEVK